MRGERKELPAYEEHHAHDGHRTEHHTDCLHSDASFELFASICPLHWDRNVSRHEGNTQRHIAACTDGEFGSP
jgi:hypothetical protein